MYQSGLEVPEGSTLRTGVCIVGSGPAALTIASELSAAELPVLLLETGSRGFDPSVQVLSAAVMTAMVLVNIVENRRRQVGGNANVWVVKLVNRLLGVRYLPLDPIDFESRPDDPYSGWPFSRDALDPHYAAAQRIAGSGPFDYSPQHWAAGTDGPWPLDPAVVDSKVFQFGPRHVFHRDLVDTVAGAPGTTIVHDATAVELETDDAGGPVRRVRCRTMAGTTFFVEADRFVVAGGGLSNPHLLLASNSARPAGLGNGHDLVGRFLQDHPLFNGGALELADPATWNRSAFYDMRAIDGHSGLGHLALSPRAIERHGLRSLGASLFPRPSDRRARSLELARELSQTARAGKLSPADISRLPTLLAGADYVPIALYRKFRWDQSLLHGFGRGGWSAMPDLHRRFRQWEVVLQAEQSPDPENRVTLRRDRDAVGMPALSVHWRWTAADARRVAEGRRLLAGELARAGVGRVRLPDDGDQPGVNGVGGIAHHMGTTRMHASPRQGVVDADCRVHGVPNLYVTGSSVFPTSGYANPTLTVIALAHRLARHLIATSGRPVAVATA